MVTSFRPLVCRPIRRGPRVPVRDRRVANHGHYRDVPSEIKRASKSELGRKLARERREARAREFPCIFSYAVFSISTALLVLHRVIIPCKKHLPASDTQMLLSPPARGVSRISS